MGFNSGFKGLNSACAKSVMIRTMRTVRTVHRAQSHYDKSTLEGKMALRIIGEWLGVRSD